LMIFLFIKIDLIYFKHVFNLYVIIMLSNEKSLYTIKEGFDEFFIYITNVSQELLELL